MYLRNKCVKMTKAQGSKSWSPVEYEWGQGVGEFSGQQFECTCSTGGLKACSRNRKASKLLFANDATLLTPAVHKTVPHHQYSARPGNHVLMVAADVTHLVGCIVINYPRRESTLGDASRKLQSSRGQ